jgi:microcystin degradation protein MlrC
MRVASGGVQHETNTFATVPTTLADFARDSGCGPELLGGESLDRVYRNTGTIHGGYITGAEQAGFSLIPLMSVNAQPSGRVEDWTFDTLLSQFLERLKQVLPVDGVLLDLHGAMVTERHEDAEGVFIDAVRALVGRNVPIVVTLDLHANITRRMADGADCIIGFDTYPHVDMFERGVEAAHLIARIVRGEVRPTMAFRQLPLITLPPMQCTLREPMQSFMQRVFALESEPGVLTATVAMGFPFADIHDAGVTVLVTTNDDQTLAERQADRLAGWLWEIRDALQPKLTPVDEVIRFAKANREGLVIYADGSDNPGGGAPCDGTVVLKALIDANFDGAVVGVLYDPETAMQAHAAGVGEMISARIGGKTDHLHGAPVELEAYVRCLSDGHYIYRGPMRRGMVGEFGPMALLVIGGVEVVVASRRQQLMDTEMIRVVGVTPEHRKLLVVKSAVHFRADLGPLASHIFDADTPGIHRPDFNAFKFENVRRPIYPLDENVHFPEK